MVDGQVALNSANGGERLRTFGIGTNTNALEKIIVILLLRMDSSNKCAYHNGAMIAISMAVEGLAIREYQSLLAEITNEHIPR